MIKALKFFGLIFLAAASISAVRATTLTNVLQNVSLQLMLYEQSTTNSQGTKVLSKTMPYTTKTFIEALQTVTGQTFEPNAKLVLSTIFSNLTVNNFTSNNLAVVPPTNNFLLFLGSTNAGEADFATNTGTAVLSNSTFISGLVGSYSITTNVVAVATNPSTFVTFITNAGYETTFIPFTNSSGLLTNVAVVSQIPGSTNLTESIFTNISTTVQIMYGNGKYYPVSNYIAFSTNSPEIVAETGTDLNTATPNLASQSGYSISNLVINYFEADGTSNLAVNLEGFVKQTLKVDIFARHGRNTVYADILGANSTWTVIGSGYYGGTFTSSGGTPVTNYVAGQLTNGFLTNTAPVVVEGTVNVSFLENLAQ